MRTSSLIAAGLLLAALAAGCAEEKPVMKVGYRVAVGGVSVEITPQGENSSLTLAADGGTVVSGNTKVEVHKLRLMVNGVDYGALQGGDDIIVSSRTDQVRVNGQQRLAGGATVPRAQD